MALAVAGTSVAFAWPAFGFFEVARGELILNTTAEMTHDSNLFAQNDAESDLYLSLQPELQFLRQAGRGTIDARVGVNVTRFFDFSEENSEDFHAALDVTYPVTPSSPLSGGFFAGLTERTEVHDFLNARVKTEETAVGLDSIYRVSDRLGLRNNLAYTDTAVEGYSDIQTYSGTFGLQWVYSEKLSYFTDYRLRRSQSDGDETLQGREVDNIDHAIFFGATGALRPRINGTASIGYQQTDSRGSEPDRGLLVTAVILDWAWRPRTSLTLGASRDLDVSPTDETVESSEVSLGLQHEVDAKISLTGHVGYARRDFQSSGRLDNAILTGAGIRYIFTRYWNAGADFTLIFNSSNVEQTDYRRHVLRAFTRYSF